MCLGIPFRVVRADEVSATVEAPGGDPRELSLLLMAEPVAPGDYVLAPVGNFAVERLDPADALETLALLRELVGAA